MEFDNYLEHYGTPRKSGRYPYGSGDNPYQHEPWFTGFNYGTYQKLKGDGLAESDICAAFGVSSTELRKMVSVGKAKDIQNKINQVQKYKDKGMSAKAISEKTGIPEPTVRTYLKNGNASSKEKLDSTVEALKLCMEKNGYVDVGAGTEYYLNVSKGKLQAALKELKDEGYSINTIKLEQVTNPGKNTTMLVLGPKGATAKDVHNNLDKVSTVVDFTLMDDGKTIQPVQYPKAIDSKRVYVKYGDDEDSGTMMDGCMAIRPGVKDLSLGGALYGQVRIMVDVDGTKKYIKGMAYYSDDIPEGYDMVLNSNKKRGSGKEFKSLNMIKDKEGNDTDQEDTLNPFGAVIQPKGQHYYEDDNGEYIKKGNILVKDETGEAESSDGKRYNLSAVNLLREEGEWEQYTKSLPTQFLSKQSNKLVQQQLKLTYENRLQEYEEICSITNPTIRKKMLKDFAEACDSDAVELKADPFPGQTAKVMLPCNSLSDDECYAPSYPDGTILACVRYPHQGTYEIPILKVNNKNKEAKSMVGDSQDVILFNHYTHTVLSGADSDGDYCTTIPFSDHLKIESTAKDPAYKELRAFDPGIYEVDYKTITKAAMQTQMGLVTNLNTDINALNATAEEKIKVAKCAQVIIDAYKHNYDWKQCFKDNDYYEIKKKYQGRANGGAVTIFSQASSEKQVNERKVFLYDEDHIDPETGEKIYEETGEMHWDKKKQKLVPNTEKSTKMAEETDAYNLVSKAQHPNELAYADYANKMKALGNETRKQYLKAEDYTTDKEAKTTYKAEVESITAKLDNALTNPPKERAAQVMATNMIKGMKKSGEVSYKNVSKESDRALTIARNLVGASKKAVQISLSDKEWEAIESKAIGSATLNKVMKYVDKEDIAKHALPQADTSISESKQALIAKLRNQDGLTIQQIAERVGVSPTTVKKYSS